MPVPLVSTEIQGAESKSPPSVSVVIPTYNRARLVGDAITSVLQQGYPRLEIVVVDDGSTDDTADVVKAFGPAVRYVRQPNGGPARARNTGIAQATGELLAFLDSDDLYLPGKLHAQVEYFARHPETLMTYCWFNIVDADGRQRLGRRCRLSGRVHRELLSQCMQGPIYPSTVMARRDALLKIGGLDESMPLSDDTDLFCRLAHLGPIGLVPEVRVQLRRLGDNVSRGPGRAKYFAVTRRILDKAFAADSAYGALLRHKLYLKARLWSWLVDFGGRMPAGMSFWLRAFWTNPLDACARRVYRRRKPAVSAVAEPAMASHDRAAA